MKLLQPELKSERLAMKGKSLQELRALLVGKRWGDLKNKRGWYDTGKRINGVYFRVGCGRFMGRSAFAVFAGRGASRIIVAMCYTQRPTLMQKSLAPGAYTSNLSTWIEGGDDRLIILKDADHEGI